MNFKVNVNFGSKDSTSIYCKNKDIFVAIFGNMSGDSNVILLKFQ